MNEIVLVGARDRIGDRLSRSSRVGTALGLTDNRVEKNKGIEFSVSHKWKPALTVLAQLILD